MIQEITSSSNRICKHIRALGRKKARLESREYIVEGIKSVRDAVSAGAPIAFAAVSDEFYAEQEFDYPECDIYVIQKSVFEGLSDTKSPQGIMAVIRIASEDFRAKDGCCYVYCDGINDPGNLGTIIRTADAAGIDGVLLSPDCADVFNPKTVRACMGSVFHVPVFAGVSADDKTLESFRFLGGALSQDSVDYRDADYTGSVVIVLGNEANGISDAVMDKCEKVKIPIAGRAESLNVSVAGAVLMYEMYRKRNKRNNG